MMMQLSQVPDYWRSLAEEARSAADGITSPCSKQLILKIAEAYERMAQRLDRETRLGHEWPAKFNVP